MVDVRLLTSIESIRSMEKEYRHHLNWDVVGLLISLRPLRNGRRIIHLADDVLNQVAKLMNTHLHVFFGSREDKSKRPHLHLVIMTEKSLDPMKSSTHAFDSGQWEVRRF